MIDQIEQHRDQLLRLCQKYDVRRLDLIGSALGAKFDAARSDLDFVVEFNNFTVETAADKFLGLMVDLEDLFGRRIDLVSYRAIHNPYFKQVVDQTRVNLYAA
ncbi:MAG: nucleotidyltransferase domain-containing protein [Tepidisphaeraceae bacterium]